MCGLFGLGLLCGCMMGIVFGVLGMVWFLSSTFRFPLEK
jgi:hypothetical protein